MKKVFVFFIVLLCLVGFELADTYSVSVPAKAEGDNGAQQLADKEGRQYGIVLKNDVNIRERPEGRSLKRVSKGTRVEIVDSEKDNKGVMWYIVTSENTTGYIKSEMVEVHTAYDPVAFTAYNGEVVATQSELVAFSLAEAEEDSETVTDLLRIFVDIEDPGETRTQLITDGINKLCTLKSIIWAAEKSGFVISEKREKKIEEDANEQFAEMKDSLEEAIPDILDEIEKQLGTGMRETILERITILTGNVSVRKTQMIFGEALQFLFDTGEIKVDGSGENAIFEAMGKYFNYISSQAEIQINNDVITAIGEAENIYMLLQ